MKDSVWLDRYNAVVRDRDALRDDLDHRIDCHDLLCERCREQRLASLYRKRPESP